MPNSQFHRLPKATNIIESTTHTSNFQPDNEFLELVCENGQILMQGGGGKSRKDLSFLTSKPKDAVNPKITRFGNLDSDFNNQEQGPPSDHIGLGQDDDMVPWLNYPLGLDDDDDDDTLQHDLGSDFFSELTGVNNNNINMNAFPSHTTNFVPPHFDNNNNNNNQMNKDFFSSSSNPTRPPPPSSSRTTPLYSKETSLRPTRLSDFITHQAPSRDSCHTPSPSQQPNTKKDHLQPPTRSSSVHPSTMAGGLMNFSHFSRPAALVKANLQSVTASPNHRGLSSIDRSRSNDKISPASSNPVDSTQIDMTSGSRSGTGFQTPPVSMAGKVNSEPSTDKPSKERLSAEQSRGICREDITRLPDQIVRQSSSFAASTTIGKNVEPLVASSSMCSGSSGPRASNDPKHKSKRKSREADESEYQSEDVEEESGSARKPGNARGGSGAKRSRAAEVHNMSERRRRDRINEKMRALQELIPNCNKVDKASMLDEAIEYLKTLQLQVQIMSMGTGLYMPQMILPPGMQRIPGQHMPHFPPMGVGMGMGMGYGMGMPDMTGNSSMMQMPPMHNMQFPCMPLSGPNNFPAIPGSSLPMFGLPGQGLPTSMASAPYPSPVGLYTKSVPVPEVSGTATPAEVPGRVSSSSLRDATHNMNSHVMQNKNAECSQNQTYQCQATGESFEQSTVAQRNDQTKQVGRTETSKLPTEMGS